MVVAGIGALLAAMPVNAASVQGPNIIGFEFDDPGAQPDPFTSEDNPTVHFSVAGSGSNELFIVDHGDWTNGNALTLDGETQTAIRVRFDVPTRRLSIRLGDDPVFFDPGDRATLKVFRGGRLIATRHVTLNLNWLSDQVIEYKGSPVTRATLKYNHDGNPYVGAEVIDDLRLDQVCPLRGNGDSNLLVGNAQANGICGRGGNDRVIGRGGNDWLDGGEGNDRIIGGKGDDLLIGGKGDDILRLADGVSGNDTAYAGAGNDICYADGGDTVYRCETVIVD
jgi:Ca2+-binding RTX toxin-like protein